MEMSEKIDQIFPAIIESQKLMDIVEKDAENPHFKSTYASLLGVRKMSKDVLAVNGLGLVVLPTSSPGEMIPGVTFLVIHKSGQWIKETCYVRLSRTGPQEIGSLHTYMRRYGEKGLFGIVDGEDDDDGNVAQGLPQNQNHQQQQSSNSSSEPKTYTLTPEKATEPITDKQLSRLYGIAKTKGWTHQDIKDAILAGWGCGNFSQIKRGEYESICTMVQSETPASAMKKIHADNDKMMASGGVPSHFGDIPPLDLNDIPF